MAFPLLLTVLLTFSAAAAQAQTSATPIVEIPAPGDDQTFRT